MALSPTKIIGRTGLAATIFFTQVMFAHRAEAHFWADRADAVRRLRNAAPSVGNGKGMLAALLAVPSLPGEITEKRALPGFPITGNPVSAPLRDDTADLLSALLPRSTLRSYADAGPGTPLVIHLQDVHGHAGAQRNIARLLAELIARRPEAPIFLEGGAGPLSRPSFGKVSDDAVRGAAAFFFNTHLISGAEVAALSAPPGTRFFGAEDPPLYLANVKAVREAALHRAGLAARLAAWRNRAETRADRLFNPALRDLNAKSRRWESGADGLGDRANFLWERANFRECPELEKFIRACRAEKTMDLAAVQRDRLSLLTALEEKMSGSTAASLAQTVLDFRRGALRPGDFYRALRHTVQKSGVALNRYPAFEAYARYVILSDDIQPEKLNLEMDALETALWTRLAKTDEERRQASLLRDLRLARGLANLTLTPDEWTAYRHRSSAMAHLPERMNETPPPPGWAKTLAPFEQFYEWAEARNAAIAQRVSSALPNPSSRHPIAILVAGGFHSAGLAPIFAALHLSVLTLSPKLDEAGDRTPFDLFTRDHTPLEQLFESPRVSLAETLGVQPIGEEGRGRKAAIDNMGPRLAALLDDVKTAPQGVRVSPGDPTLVAASPESRATDAQIRTLAAGTLIESDVPTSIDKETDSILVSVIKTDKPVFEKIREWARAGFSKMRRSSIGLLSAACLGVMLLPAVFSPSAQAAVIFNQGETLHFSVEKGDTLWSISKKIITTQGKEATQPQIARMVRVLAASNRMANPNKIRAGTSFAVPFQRTPPASTDGVASPRSVETGSVPVPQTSSERTPPHLKTAAPRAATSGAEPARRVFAQALPAYVTKQWPVELVLAIGLFLASYFIWWRPKDVDLSAVEKSDPRLKDWIGKLSEMKEIRDSSRLESEYLLPLLNNLHALILNHQITPSSVADRDKVNKQIDTYRSMARLSREVVLLLDRRFQDPSWNGNGTRDRIMDIREKIFLYQLYALKASHALVNASVAHWALSHYDTTTSWFERWKLGALLRTVRGVRTMIGTSVADFNRILFQDQLDLKATLWDQAAGLSATRLGNILVPGLYSEEKTAGLRHTLDGLVERAKSKNLPDITGKDLHRKGLSTMMGLLFWSAAILMTLSLGHATLAFLTGLGINMLLFRLQSAGTRRDAFYRTGFADWQELNRNRPHPNGYLHGDGSTPGEDPFHLNRDSIRYHFQIAQEALSTELKAENPSADVILLVAKNEEERAYFEKRMTDRRLFRPEVPVIVLPLPEGQSGSLVAYATAALFPYSAEFRALAERTPHLRGRKPWDVRIGTLVSKSSEVADMAAPLADLPGITRHIPPETLAGATVFDLAILNVYRAAQDRSRRGEGGMALRWADRAYIGPVQTGEGPGITLDTYWANREEMECFKLGAVVATPGLPMKLIRMNSVEDTLRVLTEKHPGRTYDPTNSQLDQYQGFSGEGFYGLDKDGARAQKKFLTNLLKRYGKLKSKPNLNLLTNFLVPVQIAHREPPATLTQKITTYFAQNGLLNETFPKTLLAFNLKNAQRSSRFASRSWTIRLNSTPVEGFFYGRVSRSPDPDEKPPLEPPSETGENATVDAWSRPEADLAELAAGVKALGTDPQTQNARRTIARLALSLVATAPLQTNLLDGLDVAKTRRILQRAAPGVWAGDVKDEGRLGAAGIVRRTALRSLAHQTAAIRRGATGKNVGDSLRESAFLAGLAGLDDLAIDGLRALMVLFTHGNRRGPLSLKRWNRAVADGRRERTSLESLIQPAPAAQGGPSGFTALRVTELAPGAPGTAAQRRALIAGLKRRAHEPLSGRDVLIVNGPAAARDEETIRRDLKKTVNDPALDPYLDSAKIVRIPESRFSPEDVLAQLIPDQSRRSMDLITANPAALLIDPVRTSVSYRVLLLEFSDGKDLYTDLTNVARQAFKSARVVSTGA